VTELPQQRVPRTRHYAWTVALTTFVILLFSSSTRSVFSILIEPLMKEYGWSRSVTSIPASVNLIVLGLTGPFAAALMGRYGLRSVVTGGLGLVAVGALLATQVRQPWQLVVAWGLLCGIGMGCMAGILASTVANTWFVEKRGLVTGALMAATTAGQLVFMQIHRALIDSSSWRFASVVIAVATLAGIPLTVKFIRDKPEDKGLRAYGSAPGHVTPPRVANPVGLAFRTLRNVRGSGMFWILFGSFGVCGVTTSGMVMTHWYEAASDHGISRLTAANLLVVIGVCDLIGVIGSGWLTDRVDPRRLLFVYYVLRGLSLFALERALDLGPHHLGLIVIIAFYGLDWVATIPPTIVLANQLFGRERGGIVYGWLFAAHQLGGALAAWLAALSRDWTGSFHLSYVVGGALCLCAGVGALGIGRDEHPIAHGPAAAAPMPRATSTVPS
jgi:sugar phosphate permease